MIYEDCSRHHKIILMSKVYFQAMVDECEEDSKPDGDKPEDDKQRTVFTRGMIHAYKDALKLLENLEAVID